MPATGAVDKNCGGKTPLPSSILIVGGGVFGLSTALALATRHHSGKITLIDSSPTIPNPHGSSVDSSRIIRADYAREPYAKLAATAIEKWRSTDWGREGRYTQNGLLLVSSNRHKFGVEYVKSSYDNVKAIYGDAVEALPTKEAVANVVPGYGTAEHVTGGYVNWGSGWAHAEEGVRFAKKKLDETGKVDIRTGEVVKLLSVLENGERNGKQWKVTGVQLADGTSITADLVILATGAWTGRLVDLRDKAQATGQVLSYIRISDEEQAKLANMPTVLNFSTGMFIIPPRNNVLKIARHAYGYRNPKPVPVPLSTQQSNHEATTTVEVSLPEKDAPIPLEGERACRTALREMLPAFANRPFIKTRICWYTDTPEGDFIITHHPTHNGLFLATGGSGHAYKFLPVIGEKVVDAIQGCLDPELAALWSWPTGSQHEGEGEGADKGEEGSIVWTEDGSRSGEKGLVLAEELAKGKNGEMVTGSKL
ncbi:hypothetical protein AJ80_02582 [Polytolypa hystricis UAMH7299]|uniref:FAD dependent oxidoreductase domain-containing protein n=1 Tax=Polytolypa hystricis (strain UAMH7299) TaxID=1447883 RepID=A0A2B7YQ79_POLH7|nr:hypothetical protein AJ80_02582 [Polytolypa hystricis UAMH7299]